MVRSTSDNRWLEPTTLPCFALSGSHSLRSCPSAPAKEASRHFLNGRSHPSLSKEGTSAFSSVVFNAPVSSKRCGTWQAQMGEGPWDIPTFDIEEQSNNLMHHYPGTGGEYVFVQHGPTSSVSSSDGDFLCQVDILNRIEQCDAFLHRSLKRFPSRYQAHAAGTFVDDGSLDSFFHIALTG